MTEMYVSMLLSEGEEDRLQGLKGLAGEGIDDHMPLLYAAFGDESWRVRKEAAEIFLTLPDAGDLAGKIVQLLYSSDNAGLRNTAVEILISLGRRAVPYLLEELRSPDRDVRKFALDIVGEIASPAAIPAMIEALRDIDENVRAAAAENLGKLRAEEAAPALIAALRNPELLFRFTVLEALGQIGAAVPVEALLPFWEERLLRKALIDCLGRVGGAKTVPLLVEGATDRMRNVSEAAITALGRLEMERPSELSAGLAGTNIGDLGEKLGELLNSSSAEIRQAAARLIPYLGDGEQARHLLRLLEAEETRESAAAALISLGRANPQVLIGFWPDADDRTRSYLAYLFGEAGCESACGLLLQGMESADAVLRAFCAQALGRVGGETALAPLTAALDDVASEVREAALHSLLSLCRRHGARGLELTVPFFNAEDPELRMYATMLCGAAEGEEAERRLARALKDESPLVRRAAVRGFEGRVDSRHSSTLALALTDEDAEVRRLVAELLGMISDREVLRPLQLALHDDEPWVRSAAVRALGRCGEFDGWIETALADPVGLVVITALEALAASGGKEMLPHFVHALSHADDEVVRAAIRFLSGLPDPGWIDDFGRELLHHPRCEVRLAFIPIVIGTLGGGARQLLEERLSTEGDDVVRQHIQALLGELD